MLSLSLSLSLSHHASVFCPCALVADRKQMTADGGQVIDFPNGQHEVHTVSYKQRRYPDGTVKIVHSDGRQETRYAHGRVRIKDIDGRIIMDSGAAPITQ